MTNHQPVIHIGFPKCASSLLGKQVFPHVSGWSFFNKAVSDQNSYWSQMTNRPLENIDAAALDSFRTFCSQRSIFSRPHVVIRWKTARNFGLRNIRDLTEQCKVEPHLVVVIRRQDEWWRSRFRYRNQAFRSPTDIFEKVPKVNLDYNALEHTLRKEFKFKEITFIPFERIVNGYDSLRSTLAPILGSESLRELPEKILENPVNASNKIDVWAISTGLSKSSHCIFRLLEDCCRKLKSTFLPTNEKKNAR